MLASSNRFHTLDGMRGVAAVLVVAYHFAQRQTASSFAGYLAVDIFFVISGFVIALNYDKKFKAGLTAQRFFQIRIIRLYPLYLVGLLIGLGKQLVGVILQDSRAMDLGVLTCSAMFGAVMIPSNCSTELYPLNGPSWSLFFEVVINGLFAVYLWRVRSLTLTVIMALAAVYLISAIGSPDYFNVGWDMHGVAAGAARTAFSFPAGILIFRTFPYSARRESWFAVVPLMAVAALILIDIPAGARSLAELLIVFFAFPALVAAAIQFEAPRRLARACRVLGDLSYPLYAIHWPLVAVAVPLLARLHVPAAWAASVFVAALLPIAYLASLADHRVRSWLSTGLNARRANAAQARLRAEPR